MKKRLNLNDSEIMQLLVTDCNCDDSEDDLDHSYNEIENKNELLQDLNLEQLNEGMLIVY